MFFVGGLYQRGRVVVSLLCGRGEGAMTSRDFMRFCHGRQRGVALLTALLLMLAVLMTGIAAARAAIASARVAGHERDRMLALHGE